MTQRRLMRAIIIMALFGIIAVWQHIRTVQLNYRISEAIETQKELFESQKDLQIKLTALSTPEKLLSFTKEKGTNVDYQGNPSVAGNTKQEIMSQKSIINRIAFTPGE